MHTALDRWTAIQDKHSSKLILEQAIRGGCCGCHQRLAVVHTAFLTYMLSLLSKLCCEWQPSLPGCRRRTAWSTTTKPNFLCEDQRSLTNAIYTSKFYICFVREMMHLSCCLYESARQLLQGFVLHYWISVLHPLSWATGVLLWVDTEDPPVAPQSEPCPQFSKSGMREMSGMLAPTVQPWSRHTSLLTAWLDG